MMHGRRGNRRGASEVIWTIIVLTVAVVLTSCGGAREEPASESVAPSFSSEAVRKGGSDVEPTQSDLATVARTRVFFAHQSVGMNVLDAVPGVFGSLGASAPRIVKQGVGQPGGEAGILHAYIGRNEQPLSKIEDFNGRLRAGLGNQVDVALMKFCYVDITKDSDVDLIFKSYRDTFAALERDYPKTTFVKVTVPLMTEPGVGWRVKATLGGGDRYGTAENVVRERLNSLIRTEYADDHLFDLAAIESTTPDGQRVGGAQDGVAYFALDGAYASDRGHLNAEGARRAATQWIKAIANASPK